MAKFLDLTGLQTFYTKIKNKFVAKDSLDSVPTANSTNPVTSGGIKTALDNYRTIMQDASRGANLVTNGNGLLLTNYNWSSTTFKTATDLPTGVSGCFHKNSNTFFNDEYISVNIDKKYTIESWYRVKSANTSIIRLSTACFDIDKKPIEAVHTCFGVGTLTELTQDLKPGDTVVHLRDLSSSEWLSTTTWKKGFIFWNYTNSKGYTYPPETYSRNFYPGSDSTGLWENGAVDQSNNTITLLKPWSAATIPAGTQVSRRSSGSTYYYAYSTDRNASTDWVHISGNVGGMVTKGLSDGGAFRPGTTFIKVGWVNAYTADTEWIEFAGLELRERPDKLATARKLKTNLESTSDVTFDGSSDQTNIPVTGTLPVANGGTGKTTAVDAANTLITALPLWTEDPTDNTTFIRQDRGGTSTYGRVKASTIWNYIKGKSDTTYAAKTHEHTSADISGLGSLAAKSTVEKTDLSTDVQTSLGKADSAIQTETDPTVPAWAKAATKPTYTASEVGAAESSHTHGNITTDGKLTVPSRVVVTDTASNITTSSSIDTDELYCLDGIKSNIQNQLDTKIGRTKVPGEIKDSPEVQTFEFNGRDVSRTSWLLLYDVTTAFDGTVFGGFDTAAVGFQGLFYQGKSNGYGELLCTVIEAKLNGKYPNNYLYSSSAGVGPVILKRTYTENSVDKVSYYMAIKFDAYGNVCMNGMFTCRLDYTIDVSWKSGFLGTYVYVSNTEYTVHRTYSTKNWASQLSTSRKLGVNLASTSDATFNGTADQTNIPVSGTLPIASGGTGATTTFAARYNLMNDIAVGYPEDTKFDDNTLMVGAYINQSASNGSVYKTSISKMWEYVKGKADNAYAEIEHTHSTADVTGLGTLATKSSVSDSDISGTISDTHIASASTWNSKYSKPSTGIPASDLASGVIPTSLPASDVQAYAKTGSGITVSKSVPADAVFTDTTYESKTAASSGTDVSLVTTGEKYAWNAKQNALTFDTTPMANSANPVTSGGIKNALDGKLGRGAILQTTNPFTPSQYGSIYISKIDDALYAADKRFHVTGTLSDGTTTTSLGSDTIGLLFNGSYENGLNIGTKTAKLSITFPNETSQYFPGYPYGQILVSFYYVAAPKSVSARCYCNQASQGVGWKVLTATKVSSADDHVVYSISNGYYAISEFEITVEGDDTNSYHATIISEIEMKLDRPDSARTPVVSKYRQETLYYDLTAPNFKGNLDGKLKAARSLKVSLSSSDAQAFDGSADATAIGVSGQLADANIASASTWNSKQDALTFDSAPTSSSTNPVTSGGVYNALANKTYRVAKAVSQNKYLCINFIGTNMVYLIITVRTTLGGRDLMLAFNKYGESIGNRCRMTYMAGDKTLVGAIKLYGKSQTGSYLYLENKGQTSAFVITSIGETNSFTVSEAETPVMPDGYTEGSVGWDYTIAKSLHASRSLQVSLSTSEAQAFDGSSDATSIGVSGQLADDNIASASTWNSKQDTLLAYTADDMTAYWNNLN